jgi:hypothetical protein
MGRKGRPWTDYEYEVLQSHVELESENIKKAHLKVAELLKRSYADVCKAYYTKRGEFRSLFVLADNKKGKTFYNTKNVDRFGKFRSDLHTSSKIITLKFYKVTKK